MTDAAPRRPPVDPNRPPRPPRSPQPRSAHDASRRGRYGMRARPASTRSRTTFVFSAYLTSSYFLDPSIVASRGKDAATAVLSSAVRRRHRGRRGAHRAARARARPAIGCPGPTQAVARPSTPRGSS
ncbi:MAG: hypothetical protein WDM88_07075 [Galbitalea sp.]